MDLWVVAVVAGAGYLAKNWQSSSTVDKETSDDELFSRNSIMGESNFRNLLERIRDKTCPFRRLARERQRSRVLQKQKDDVLDRNGGSNGGVAGSLEADEYNVHQLTRERSYGSMEFAEGDTLNHGSLLGNEVDEYNVHWSGSNEVADAANSNHLIKRSKPLRSRTRHTGYVIRPLDSVESCVAAQLCREHESVEEYVYISLHSPSVPVLRPLLITDGSRIINGGSVDSSSTRPGVKEDDGEPHKQRKPRSYSSRELARSCSGSQHRMILFFLGITFGIMSILTGNKREVEKLSNKLKQKQRLVQDLSEELDMKDAVTVRELANEASQPVGVDDAAPHCHRVPSTLPSHDDEKQTIEAELEAELERLELNLKASSSLERICDHVEVDADLQSSYYAVSPRELRLQLHEVIEARLEARIEELEAALGSSESKLHSLESQRGLTWSEAELSSTPQSPIYMFQDTSDKDEPLLINLAGNALEAYNEAYAEMHALTDSDKETTAQPLCWVRARTGISEDRTSTSLRSSEEGNTDEEEGEEVDVPSIKRIVERRRSGAKML